MKRLDFTILAAILIVFTLLTYFGKHLTGFPTGIDTYAHLFRIKFVLDNFPNINWNPFWDAGTPFWLWSHPPLPAIVQAFLVKILGITPEVVLTSTAAASFFLMLVGIYIFVLAGWGRLPAVLAILLILGNPGSFGWWSDGNYTRVFGLGFWGLAFGFTALLFKSNEEKIQKISFVIAILSSIIAHSSHLLIGAMTGLSVALIILFWGKNARLANMVKLVFLPAITASYWYIPMIMLGNPSARFLGGTLVSPVELRNFIYPLREAEHFALLPILPAVFLTGLFANRIYTKKEAASYLPILILTVFAFAYLVVGYLPGYPKNAYINGMPPISAFPAFAIFFAILTATLWGRVNVSKRVLYLILGMTLLGVALNIPSLVKARRDMTIWNMQQSFYKGLIKVDPSDDSFRFGTDTAFVSDWFSYEYKIPQTRDYFNQGQLYPDWISYLEKAVWYWDRNYEETNFLFDWYAVKHFVVGEPHYNVPKFLDKPEFYREEVEQFSSQPGLVEGIDEIYQFEYKNASPILAGIDTPTILVIGSDAEYDSFFRSLALSGFTSLKIIPIKGGEKVSSFSRRINEFSGIFIYGPENLSPQEVKTLKEYVEGGGNLFIETTEELGEGELPDIFPIRSVHKGSVEGGLDAVWQEEALINPSLFSPFKFGNGPWKMFFANSNEVREWSKPLLVRGKEALIVVGELGKGRVVWSGLNFPYHLKESRNSEEVKLFSYLFYDFPGFGEGRILSEGKFNGTESREIFVPTGTLGVLLKESYFGNWKAYLTEKGKRRETEILRAGPDFMYVFTTDGTSKVEFEYKTSLIEKSGWGITFLVLGYIFLVLRTKGAMLEAFSQKFSGWWERED